MRMELSRFLSLSLALRAGQARAAAAAGSSGVTVDLRRLGRDVQFFKKVAPSNSSAARAFSSVSRIASGGDAPTTPGILFDIDGVFKHGGAWEPKGMAVLRRVQEAGVPYAFMTNGGGGRIEEEYAAEMSTKLTEAEAEALPMVHGGTAAGAVAVDAAHMVLSYSPWRLDLAELVDKPVLVVGDPAERVMDVARHYGFTKAMHISEYDARHPLMNPFKHDNTKMEVSWEDWSEGFAAICVFTDPLNFFEALQICTDVLLSSRPGEVEVEPAHKIPIYFSNPDLLWKTQYPHGRFGQGAFRIALEALYKARLEVLGVVDKLEENDCSGHESFEERMERWYQYGKPEVVQFEHAIAALLSQVGPGELPGETPSIISDVYMVGDNPASDMQGVINMNTWHAAAALEPNVSRMPKAPKWHGALVRTGVYREGLDSPNGAVIIADDVAAAVEAILERHGL